MTSIMPGWVTPIGNQAFREQMVRHLNPTFAASGQALPRGTGEMTLPELAASPSYERQYFQRLAICFSSIALPVFGMAVVTRNRINRRLAITIGLASPFVFLILMELSRAGIRTAHVPASTIAWLPTVVFIVAALVMVRGMDRSTNPITDPTN